MDTNLSMFKRQLTRKELAITLVIGFLFIVNLIVLLLFVVPESGEKAADKALLSDKEQELQTVRTQYGQDQLRKEQLDEVQMRVPVKRADSANMIFFNDLAGSSKTLLGYIRQASGEEGGGQAAGTEGNAGTVMSEYDLMVLGHLPAIRTYMEKLHDHKRLFSLSKWNMNEITADGAAADYPDLFSRPFINKSNPVYAMQITVEAYAFPQLQQAFSELEKKN